MGHLIKLEEFIDHPLPNHHLLSSLDRHFHPPIPGAYLTLALTIIALFNRKVKNFLTILIKPKIIKRY